jgi:hypothetical protein
MLELKKQLTTTSRGSVAPETVLPPHADEDDFARLHARNFRQSHDFVVDKKGQKSVGTVVRFQVTRDQGWRWRSGSTPDTVLHFVLLLSTLVNVIGVPLGLGFFGTKQRVDVGGWGGLLALYALADCAFVFDLVRSFLTIVEVSPTRPPLVRLGKIRRWYLTRWFVLDAIAVLPLDWGTNCAWLRVLRFAKLPRLLLHFHWLRRHRAVKVAVHSLVGRHRPDLLLADVFFAGWLRHAVVLLAFAHVGACGWYAVGRDNGESWLVDEPTAGDPKDDLPAAYSAAFWWALSTAATLGGHTEPTCHAERAYAIVYLLVAVGLSAHTLVALIVAAFERHSNATLERRKLHVIGAWARRAHLPPSLRHRLVRVFETRSTADEQNAIMAMMPPALREDVAQHLARGMVRDVPLFWSVTRECVPTLLAHLKPATAAPLDYLFRKGAFTTELHILLDGRAISFDEETPLLQFGPGDFVGEAGLLDKGAHEYSAIAVTVVRSVTLSREAAYALAAAWPELPLELAATFFLRAREDAATRRKCTWEVSRKSPRADSSRVGETDRATGPADDDANLDDILKGQAEEQQRAVDLFNAHAAGSAPASPTGAALCGRPLGGRPLQLPGSLEDMRVRFGVSEQNWEELCGAISGWQSVG